MNKRKMIAQLQECGVVAAHLNDQNVDVVSGVPKKVTFSLPIFKSKAKIDKGDKIAIVDMDNESAVVCEVTRVEAVGFSKKPLLHLKGSRKIRLS